MADLAELKRLRAKVHRTDPSRPIRDGRGAAAFVRERQIVMAEGRAALPILTEAIAGREIRGSWMADPEVHRIHRVWTRMSGDFFSVPLVLGKHAICDASLGAAVERVASDAERRERALSVLPALARRLLEDVERDGSVRMDAWSASTKEGRKARKRLETDLLVVSEGVHTDRGYHTAIVRSWDAGNLSARFGETAAALTFDEAADELFTAAVRSAVVAPEREGKRWFVFGEEPVERLVEASRIERFRADRATWLTAAQ